jgi:hypothetical protein
LKNGLLCWKSEVTQDTGKRKREETKLCGLGFLKADSPSASDSSISLKSNCLVQWYQAPLETYSSLDELWPLFYSAIGSQSLNVLGLERVGKLCQAKGIEPKRAITAFQQWVNFQNAVPCPRADSLLVLVKFNVFRALFSNGRMLGFSTAKEYFDDNAISSFAKSVEMNASLLSLPPLPLALRPSSIQCQISHHPSLDLLPDPQMRDNLIQASGTYDEEKLCADLLGMFGCSQGRNGLIIWGEPWDPAGWEVTEPFSKHWAWALRGCDELLRATNQWRDKRGEPPLKFVTE